MREMIDVANVRRVLLADGWHTVAENSFGLDSYEYGTLAQPLQAGASPTRFRFKDERGSFVYGLVTAVLESRTI